MFVDDGAELIFGFGTTSEACEALHDDERESLVVVGMTHEITQDELVLLFVELTCHDIAEFDAGSCKLGIGMERVGQVFDHACDGGLHAFALCASFEFAHAHPVGIGVEILRADHFEGLREPSLFGVLCKVAQNAGPEFGKGEMDFFSGAGFIAAEEKIFGGNIDHIDTQYQAGFVVHDTASECDIAADSLGGVDNPLGFGQ